MLLEFATVSQGVAIETHVISDRERHIMDVKAKHLSLFLEMLLDVSEHECYTKLCFIKLVHTFYTLVFHLLALLYVRPGLYIIFLCFLHESCTKTGLVLETFFRTIIIYVCNFSK